MGALQQRQVWYVTGLSPLERLVMYRLAQRCGPHGMIPTEYWNSDIECMRCCVDKVALTQCLLKLHGMGHITLRPDFSIKVHPILPESISDQIFVNSKKTFRNYIKKGYRTSLAQEVDRGNAKHGANTKA